MSYKVKLDVFEGPFDLLVYLIENAQMSIYDIQIAEITAEYVAYIEKMKEMDINVAGEFLVLAAQLIEIKSRMILPRVQMDDDGMMIEEDPRTELVERLLEYKKFKNAAEGLKLLEEEALMIYEKPQEDISMYTNEPDEYLTLEMNQFVNAFNLFLSKKQRLEAVRKRYTRIERQRENTEEKKSFIKGFFKSKKKRSVPFKELLKNKTRYEAILTFTSLLELEKEKSVLMKQYETYGDITIEDRQGETDQDIPETNVMNLEGENDQ